MSADLPTASGGTILPEYAATSSTTVRTVRKIGSSYAPGFSGTLNYSLIRYLLDANGAKVSILQPEPYIPEPGQPWNDPNQGSIQISEETLLADLMADPVLAAAFETIAAYEDAKIRADLVARGILTV